MQQNKYLGEGFQFLIFFYLWTCCIVCQISYKFLLALFKVLKLALVLSDFMYDVF